MNAISMRSAVWLNVELAVAFELAAAHLNRARSQRQLELAISINLRLWRAVRALVQTRPDLCERESLADTADHVATMLVVDASPHPDLRDLAFVAGRNLALAEDLVGTGVGGRALADVLARWGGRGTGPAAFENWLIDRIGACAAA